MKIPRQARLKSAILLVLVEGDVASVVELARRVDASRPSTSRAFAGLARKGFVQTIGRRRSLTDEGRQAAADLLSPSSAVQRAMESEQRKIDSMIERAQVKHFLGSTAMLDTVRSLERDIRVMNRLADGPTAAIRLAATGPMSDITAKVADMMRVTGLPELAIGKRFAELELDALKTLRIADLAAAMPDAGTRSILADITKRFANMPIPKGVFADLDIGVSRETLDAFARIGSSLVDRDLTDFVAKTSLFGRELAAAQVIGQGAGVAAAVDAMRLQMDALAPMMVARADWVPLITENLAVNTGIVRDRFAIAEFVRVSDASLRKRHRRIASMIDPLIVANRDHTAAELGRIVKGSADERTVLFVPPSITTRRLAGVARLLLDGEDPHEGADLPDAGDLLDMLDRRGMSAVSRDLRGARDALVYLRHGWAKSCAHLLREAFRELLLVIAPDDQIPNPARERLTRKMRIGFAIGSESETLETLVDSAATGWDGMVAYLSSEAHREEEPRLDRAGMVGVLVAVEGTIRILIAAHEIGKGRTE